MTVIVKPVEGRKVRRPDQGYRELPAQGMPVVWGPYWERLLRDGDVVVLTEAQEQVSVQVASTEDPAAPSGKGKRGSAGSEA